MHTPHVLVRHYQTPTSINDEDVSKVLLGRGIVASEVEHTAAYTVGTVASTTFDPLPRDILLLPFRGIYMYTHVDTIIYYKLYLC